MVKTKGKVRIGVMMEGDVRDATLVVRDHVRILPSHQIDLALRRYLLDEHKALLEKHGIKLSYVPGR